MHSGKYLNVIRECGKDIKYPYPEHENMLIAGSRFTEQRPKKNEDGEDDEMKDENRIDAIISSSGS